MKNNMISIIWIGLLIILYILVHQCYIKPRGILYPNFGIQIPAGYYVHGIDVSRHQGNINWEQVAQMRDKGQRISFAIIKATEGTWLSDNTYSYNWKQAKKNNLVRGAYLFFHPNEDGHKQAQYFIENTNLEKGDLAPIIDIEVNDHVNTNMLQTQLDQCIKTLEKKYKKKPIIYSNVDFYKNYLGTKYDNLPFWAAHYHQTKSPSIDRNWILWQHSDRGRVNGISGNVDFNVCQGSIENLLKHSLHDM